jgi:hypothetical protein
LEGPLTIHKNGNDYELDVTAVPSVAQIGL